MCLEDVKIGRNTQPHSVSVTASATSQQLVPGSGSRWSLHVMPPSSGVIWLSPGNLAVAGQGYVLAPGDPPLVLTVQHDGEQIVEPWCVVADAGAPIVTAIDTTLIFGSERWPIDT